MEINVKVIWNKSLELSVVYHIVPQIPSWVNKRKSSDLVRLSGAPVGAPFTNIDKL